MRKLGKLEELLCEICQADDASTALWLSGGKDSRLLLEVLLAQKLSFSVLRFDTAWTREQKRVTDELIMRHGLQVYSYKPAQAAIFGTGRRLAMVAEYAIGSGSTFPVLMDIVDGPRCGVKDVRIQISGRSTPPIRFATHILGSKRGDRHYALNGRPAAPGLEWKVGESSFAAPLFEWSDRDVVKALELLGVNYIPPASEREDSGNLVACHACLQGKIGKVYCPAQKQQIDSLKWNPRQRLAEWQKTHGIGDVDV